MAETTCLIILFVVFAIFVALLLSVVIWTLINVWEMIKDTMRGL